MFTMIFSQLLHLIPQALIAIACFIYISRTQSLAGVIALIGSLGRIAVSIGSAALIVMISQGHMAHETYGYFSWAVQGGYLITSLMFALGFIGIASTAKRRQKPQTDQGYITTER